MFLFFLLLFFAFAFVLFLLFVFAMVDGQNHRMHSRRTKSHKMVDGQNEKMVGWLLLLLLFLILFLLFFVFVLCFCFCFLLFTIASTNQAPDQALKRNQTITEPILHPRGKCNEPIGLTTESISQSCVGVF